MCNWRLYFYLSAFFYNLLLSFLPCAPMQSVKSCCEKYAFVVNLDLFVIVQFTIVIIGLILFIFNLYCSLQVAYVTFHTNLNIINRKTWDKSIFTSEMNEYILYWLLLALIATESPFGINLANFLHFYSGSSIKFHSPTLKVFRPASLIISFVIYFYILAIAVTPVTHLLCLIITYFLCVKVIKNIPFWVPFLLILLSNDIELNPGDHYHENFFSFMNWKIILKE